LRDRKAVHLGQPQIEDDEIVILGPGQEVAFLAVGGDIDGVALRLEAFPQELRDLLLVLDDQDAHLRSEPLAFLVVNIEPRSEHVKSRRGSDLLFFEKSRSDPLLVRRWEKNQKN
jgi:hypothetical protein